MYQPLFILCPGRSFSSVVCGAIGQHPDLYGLPEMNLCTAESIEQLFRGKRFMLHGLVRVISQLHHGIQTESTIDTAWQWLEKCRNWSTTKMYYYLSNKIAPKRFVDKTPTYATKMENLKRIRKMFPDAYFLHLSRHPRTTSNSLHRVHSKRALFRPNYKLHNPEVMERHWFRVHRNIFSFTEELPPDQFMRLQGEILLENPIIYFQQIAEWLHIRTDAEAIKAMEHPENSPFACIGPNGAGYGNNPDFLQDPVLRMIKPPKVSLFGPLEWFETYCEFSQETIDLARKLGYQ